MELPQHPDTGKPAAPGPVAGRSWGARIFVGLLVAAVVLVVMLHLTGVVGPSGH